MTVCLDTNVFLQIFRRKQPYHQILRAMSTMSCLRAYKPQPVVPEEFIRVHLASA